jgi:hypothetical protein
LMDIPKKIVKLIRVLISKIWVRKFKEIN